MSSECIITKLPFKEKDLKNVVIVDPARTAKLHSADSAIVGVGISRHDHAILVRRVVSGKYRPDELYDRMFQMVVELRAMVLAVEVTGLSEFIEQPIENEIIKRSIPVRFEKLNARGGRSGDAKEMRVAALAPFYRQGYIYHNPDCCEKLEMQLRSFPRSKLWDVMDALAYIVQLMDLEMDFFEPVNFDDAEPENYDDLEDDKPIENWRIM